MYQRWTALTKLAKQMNQDIEGGEGEEEIFYSNCQNKVYKYKTKVHEIIKQTWNPFTENFGRTSYSQISYLILANIWRRSAVAYGLTCGEAC